MSRDGGPDYYPGDDTVDIIGTSQYFDDGGLPKDVVGNLLELARLGPDKPLWLAELGPLARADFPMPFRKRARITLENCGQEAVPAFWYHVEYELYDRELPADAAYFHAHWRREAPTRTKPVGN